MLPAYSHHVCAVGLSQPGFGTCMLVSGLRHARVRLQVSYDLLDTYPGGPYKGRGGSIKKTRFAEEEEDDDDDDDEEDQVLLVLFPTARASHRNRMHIESDCQQLCSGMAARPSAGWQAAACLHNAVLCQAAIC